MRERKDNKIVNKRVSEYITRCRKTGRKGKEPEREREKKILIMRGRGKKRKMKE